MIFAAVVALAFAVEASLGFGGTLVAVSVGALFFPVEIVLPALVPLNMILSSTIALRDRSAIAWRELVTRVLPWMALGLPLGLFAFRAIDLRLALGAVLIVFALLRVAFARSVARASAPASARALLFAAGVVHGALGTGGPLVVAALGDRLDKRAFRATLAVLWLVMNCVLLAGFIVEKRVDLALSAQGVVGVLIGAVLGEVLFRRLGNFQRAVWIGLALTGVVLLVRSL